MLFHSPEFIFGFLPLCFLGFVAVHRLLGLGGGAALAGRRVAGVLWPMERGSGRACCSARSCSISARRGCFSPRSRSRRTARRLLLAALAANLALLGYFKYTNFLIDNANLVAGCSLSHLTSFCRSASRSTPSSRSASWSRSTIARSARSAFGHYLLFGSFFPCVTAGPIVLQKDMLPQFASARPAPLDSTRIAVALTVFGIGLFKKLLLADSIAPSPMACSTAPRAALPWAPALAWIGALAYTLQLYFDFSAYSDMALGIAYLFGFKLPLNFNSPLKACSITDFWRRWHMTMTRFFTNYLYAPIAVPMMRRALRAPTAARPASWWRPPCRSIATFVLAGLWHGAGWTFVVFGLIHGLALAINHAWREAGLRALPPAAGWLLTMAVVIVGLVLFRAADVPTALALIASMLGMTAAAAVGGAATVTGLASIAADPGAALVWIVVLGTIALACPNTQELMSRHWFSSDPQPEAGSSWPSWLTWRPTPAWARSAPSCSPRRSARSAATPPFCTTSSEFAPAVETNRHDHRPAPPNRPRARGRYREGIGLRVALPESPAGDRGPQHRGARDRRSGPGCRGPGQGRAVPGGDAQAHPQLRDQGVPAYRAP